MIIAGGVLTIFAAYWAIVQAAGALGRGIAHSDRGKKRNRLRSLYEALGWVNLGYSAVILLGTPALSYLVYEDRILEGLVGGIALLWFIRTQLPTLLPPRLEIFFHHWNSDSKKYDEAATDSDWLDAAKSFLIVRVMNLGVSPYNHCTCSVTLFPDSGLAILPRDEANLAAYSDVNYNKAFDFQSQNNCAAFPLDREVTLHPGDSLFCPVMVEVRQESDKGLPVQIEVNSTSAWFHRFVHRTISVSQPVREGVA